MYHESWADWYVPAAGPALEKLFFLQLRRGARVLDLCCGSGHFTKELVRRGYVVTGIDSSEALIEIARREMPSIKLVVEDARALQLPDRYEGVISTFDSLNHMMSLAELHDVFMGVHRVLENNGLFVFDMNLEQAYFNGPQEWTVNADDDDVRLVHGAYDPATKRASTELIWFTREPQQNLWNRRRVVVDERCYKQEEILMALTEAGFRCVEAISALDAGMEADVGFGRIFLSARR